MAIPVSRTFSLLRNLRYGLVGDNAVIPGGTVASQMQTKLTEMFYVNRCGH